MDHDVWLPDVEDVLDVLLVGVGGVAAVAPEPPGNGDRISISVHANEIEEPEFPVPRSTDPDPNGTREASYPGKGHLGRLQQRLVR